MHELSIAEALVEEALKAAEENGLFTVEEVEIEVGALKLIVPELIQDAFRQMVAGTIAEGAVLKINEIPGMGSCRNCKNDFELKINDYRCPICNQAEIKVTRGDAVYIKSVVGQKKDEEK
ncbi:MAG: hydrogenase maturation nickel metallochaperone HypA [Candidatus Omnitrophica bacterium]|nr:hydrogenase maturation nickel metallochaperone HypA [Candidatus Omnitrophota bacterium]